MKNTNLSLPLLRIISWGCGEQSTAMVVMSILGDLPKVDLVIHSDLHWERAETIVARDAYKKFFESQGIWVEIVDAGNIRELGGLNHQHMPFWTQDGAPLRRQCTRHFKVDKINAFLKHVYHQQAIFSGILPRRIPAGAFEQWIGFAYDEFERMKTSRVQYITNRYPLVEKRLTKALCQKYIAEKLGGYDLPPLVKSACIGCPYRNAIEYEDMNAVDFADAIAFDEAIRHLKPNPKIENDELYIFRGDDGPIPLAQADIPAQAHKLRERQSREGFQPPLCTDVCWT